MKNSSKFISNPFNELKNIKSLTLCAMLIALCAVSSMFTFYIGESKITFSFIFIAIIAMKFGPIIAGLSAGMADIIQYILITTGVFQPLLTLSCVATGVIFGLFLYKNNTNLWRIIVSKALVTILISIFINTYFLVPIYGVPYLQLIIPRTVFYLAILPAEILILALILTAAKKIDKSIK